MDWQDHILMHMVDIHAPDGLKSHNLTEESTVTGCGRFLRRTIA